MRPLAVVACACLLAAGAAGCATTQDKAAAQQARAERILKARADRQKTRKRHRSASKPHHSAVDGPKTGHMGRFSARRYSDEEER